MNPLSKLLEIQTLAAIVIHDTKCPNKKYRGYIIIYGG
jgi:hypothetical protein